MPNKSVLRRPKVQENLSRNAFDRSFMRNMHCSHGQIVPFMMEPCIAGTKGVINRKCFTRTFDVVAPAFSNIKQYFDFFKVPIRYLWTKWPDWKLNVNDIGSSSLSFLDIPDSLGSIPRMNFGYQNGETFSERAYGYLADSVPEHFQRCTYMNNMQRLLEGLGYGVFSTAEYSNVKNLLPVAAYQKVYYDHYRNTSYEANNPYAYNLDWLTDRGGMNDYDGLLNPTGETDQQNVFSLLFELHHVNYRNDYFRNLYPSVSYSENIGNDVTWTIPNIPQIGATSTSYRPELSNQGTRLFRNGTSNNSFIPVNNIRALFALDKLARASAYAPKHVRDQFKARFGVDVGNKSSHESERIGSFFDTVVIGEVTNQADTLDGNVGSPLGALGGKGIGASKNDEDLHFYCEEDSIIIGLTYFLVDAVYDSVQDEWNNYLTREEFFNPEFQNLGLRTVYDNDNRIVGYTVPNLRYKLGKDLNFGMFRKSYRVWQYNNTAGTGQEIGTYNELRSFTVHSEPPAAAYPLTSGVNYMYFKALPNHLDYIFRTSFDSVGNYNTDQFFFNLAVKFATVQNMSVHGQPSL